ncbi:MAG: M23 family metallopeptidase [Ardenticatenaceae bacterium]|nr:M23 family metallopeptidase [Anaerolineales bacterium]MCB8941553.1 M23 family metallopeptidase [Ardenticatenaceae bacterium]MCB8974553.1 M23 family metallopeptidase [Ardenticatenaceae bacterium]
MRYYRLLLLALLGALLACATPPAPVATPTPFMVVAASPQPLATVTAVPPTATLPMPTSTPPIAPSATPAPVWDNPLDMEMQATAVAHNANFYQLLPANSGRWQFDVGSFWHPIALEMNQTTAFLLDGGRVLALDLVNGTPPTPLLQPGDFVDGLLVQEPLDLALVGPQLLVQDRAGDLYALDLAARRWQIERYEREIGATSSHYFVALGYDTVGAARRLRLETSYSYAQYFFAEGQERQWLLPEEALPVDVSGLDDRVYVLWGNLDGTATVALFQETARLSEFAPTVVMTQPRQIFATETAVFILDQAGNRLLSLNPATGALQALFHLPGVSAFAVSGEQLLFAGRDQLFFWQQPENNRIITSGSTLPAPQPHDTAVWQTTAPYAWPITGNSGDLTPRDLQMPGAPRHYRLGIHEGTDFYWANGTPVYAAASGTVIRATLDYERPSETAFNRRRAENIELGYTAPDNLDFYRGMQIWVAQEDGFVARYVHLSEIKWDVMEGTAVTAGQQIGRIGNTGSPASINSETEDAHLHFELWLDDFYLGQFLRPIETRELVAQLFAR